MSTGLAQNTQFFPFLCGLNAYHTPASDVASSSSGKSTSYDDLLICSGEELPVGMLKSNTLHITIPLFPFGRSTKIMDVVSFDERRLFPINNISWVRAEVRERGSRDSKFTIVAIIFPPRHHAFRPDIAISHFPYTLFYCK